MGEMEMMAEALWALVHSAPASAVTWVRTAELLLVQQREAIRKAHEFDQETIPRFACLTAEAASKVHAISWSSCQHGALRDWFLPQLSEITKDDLLIGTNGLMA